MLTQNPELAHVMQRFKSNLLVTELPITTDDSSGIGSLRQIESGRMLAAAATIGRDFVWDIYSGTNATSIQSKAI